MHTHTHTPGAVDTHTPGAVDTHTHTHTPGAVDTHTPGAVDTHTHTHTHTWSRGAHTHTPGAVDTHTHTHTHTHTWSSPGEQLGVWCLAQGSHLSRGQFLPEPRFEPTTSGYKSNALSIRSRMPRLTMSLLWKFPRTPKSS